jgi:hypothetical protein
MQYEETKVKNNIKEASGKTLVKAAKMLPTYRLLWIIMVRHKVALLATSNAIMVINWAIPQWPEFVKSII